MAKRSSSSHSSERPLGLRHGGSGAPAWAGLDGCRAGWVLATITAVGPPAQDAAIAPGVELRLSAHRALVDAVAEADASGVAALGIDMPIGLASDGHRLADLQARRLLGSRRSTVFPTPARAVLDATDFPDALRRSRHATGKGLSLQAWNLVPKIAEVDEWITPDHSDFVFEVHPELAFAVLSGEPLDEPKRTPAGRARRLDLLAAAMGLDAGERRWFQTARLGGGVAGDDVLDAIAVACSTRRLASGQGTVLGDGTVDDRGLPLRICF